MKVCRQCKIPKELDKFSKSKLKIGDYICKECNKLQNRQNYLNNKEKHKERSKQWYLDNKGEVLEKSKQYYLDNRVKIKEYYKQYDLDNKEKRKQYNKQYEKQRRQLDPLYKFSHNVRTRIYQSLINKGYKKNTKTEQILGCTIEEFKDYISSQFLHPMSLENHGLIWEIDHKIHISSAKTEEEVIQLNHYTNLRPLFKTTEIAEGFGYDDVIGNRNKGASSIHD